MIKLDHSDSSINYFHRVMTEPYVQRWMIKHYKGPAGFVRMIDALRDGSSEFFVPVLEKDNTQTALGLVWGEGVASSTFSGNIAFFKDVWGPLAFRGAQQVEDHLATRYDSIIGYVDANNNKSFGFMKRLGYEVTASREIDNLIHFMVRKYLNGNSTRFCKKDS